MIFEIHKEGKISYKRLSGADLKRSRSNQTHIGLSNDSLTFMPDDKTEYSAMLIYNGYCDILNCEIAKIHRANGKYDAPKISKGKQSDNVVNKIRSFANESGDKVFYLLWFGLDSLTPVFWLIEDGSSDYSYLNKFCNFGNLKNRSIKILKRDDIVFSHVLAYAQSRIENATIDLQKDLELSVELEKEDPKFKDADVKKARSYINELGKQGEALIDEYLSRQKFERLVSEYEWMNKSSEQGKPFDFYIKYSTGLEQWIDVKTTEHEFEQAVIISKNEIRFITEKKNPNYAIFRVYSKQKLQAKLRRCFECLKYMEKLLRDMDYMTKSMADYQASLVNYKIAFVPSSISFHKISDEEIITYNKGLDLDMSVRNVDYVDKASKEEESSIAADLFSLEKRI